MPARLGATAAGLGTIFHMLLIAQTLTTRGAALANLGADAAGAAVQVRTAQHKVGAGLTDLGTIEKQADMRCRGMLAAHLQTMGNRLNTDAMTVRTLLNTASHRAIYSVMHRVT